MTECSPIKDIYTIEKIKDLYKQWLFNKTTLDMILNFIYVQEDMNLRYREGVAL